MRPSARWLGPAAVALAAAALRPSGAGGAEEASRGAAQAAGVEATRAKGARVSLPATADGAATVSEQASGVYARFRLEGARPSPAERAGAEASYAGALGPGTTLVLGEIGRGLEDRVLFEQRPAEEAVHYHLETSGFSGLRRVSGAIELLDGGGAPRLRIEPPEVSGADGRVARASVEIGCAHDHSPAPPWGRPVTPPGAPVCRLSVRWSGQGVAYPAVLDPVWATTSSMLEARIYPGSGRLTSGRVLVFGGQSCPGSSCAVLTSAELFDPATGTWAQTAPMSGQRARFATVTLPGRGVLALGGSVGGAGIADCELYDEKLGGWQAVPPMPTPRSDMPAVLLADGSTVVVGGGALDQKSPSAAVERLDLKTLTWSSAADLGHARFFHTASLLSDGTVLFVGGTTCSTCLFPVAPTEIFDPATNQVTAGPPPIQPRFGHVAIGMTIDGEQAAVVLGGLSPSAEYYVPKAKEWAKLPDMAVNRTFHRAVVLPDGSALVVGGAQPPSVEAVSSSERLDPVAKAWASAGDIGAKQAAHVAELLADGRVLSAGGVAGVITKSSEPATAVAALWSASGLGALCGAAGECASGQCVEGVCCDAPCNGECASCLASKKGQGKDGECGPIGAGSDPDGECADLPVAECQTTGVCDGAGKCARYPEGTPCKAPVCDAGTLTVSQCDSSGKCLPKASPCAPYVCAGAAACGASCQGDADCAPSAHCVAAAKSCVGNKAQGEPCEKGDECSSGACVDGVCCSSACDGLCQACSAEKKQSGDKSGVCGPAKAGTDPHGDCDDQPVSSCDRDGSCDGGGQCALHKAGTPCLDPACVGSPSTELSVEAYACDGSGTCQGGKPASCGLYGCSAGACRASCASGSDCVDHAFCQASACVPRKDIGQPCTSKDECLQGFCVDGVCCNAPCDKPCEACDVTNAAGLCVPVAGKPHGARPSCEPAPPATPCQARACDGVVRESCEGFVAKVACREASCQGGVAVLAASCDGKGSCPDEEQRPCQPFVCQGAICAASCKDDAGCSEKFRCDVEKGDCVPREGASCDGNHTLVAPDGTRTDCAPFKCEGASCRRSCASVLDCVLPNVCDEQSHACVPAQPNPTQADSGCAASPHRPQAPAPLAALAGLAALAALAGLGRKRPPRPEHPGAR